MRNKLSKSQIKELEKGKVLIIPKGICFNKNHQEYLRNVLSTDWRKDKPYLFLDFEYKVYKI